MNESEKAEARMRDMIAKLAPLVRRQLASQQLSAPQVEHPRHKGFSPDDVKRIVAKARAKIAASKGPATQKIEIGKDESSGTAPVNLDLGVDSSQPKASVVPAQLGKGMLMPNYLSTGFDALNKLLGGHGFHRGSAVIIVGEPGTGKTTLALQIAKNAIANEGHAFVYVSVEQPPEVLLNQITESFWDTNFEEYLGDRDKWAIEDLTRYFDKDVRKEAFERIVTEFVHTILEDQPDENTIPEAVRPIVQNLLHDWPQEQLHEALRLKTREMELDQVLRRFWERSEIARFKDRPVLVVMDSLTALINGAKMRFREFSDRHMFQAVLNSFTSWRSSVQQNMGNAPTIVLIAEKGGQRPSLGAQSPLADVVIRLSLEELRQTTAITPGRTSSWTQELLFCQVLKGRGLPIQRRLCCCEFVNGEDPDDRGIKFFPAYAAQGVISFFYENQPQLRRIEDFRTIDVPSRYPKVIVEQFARSDLQNMFAVQRYIENIPPRHPLMLSDFDEYWVSVLKDAGLLRSIPSSKLLLCDLPIQEEPDPTGKSTRFIEELAVSKEELYRDDHGNYFAVPQNANIGLLVYRKDLLREVGEPEPPETWEDLVRICRLLREKGKAHRLLVETMTYDTLLVTALEMGWGHGAFWRTRKEGKDVRMEFEHGSQPASFVATLLRLHYLIHKERLIPPNSSVDVDLHQESLTDWVFARHWYSTWVDLRTRTDEAGKPVRFPDKVEFGVAPLPISKAYREQQGDKPKHHSCWGEWSLAIGKSSENLELGIDLINNMNTYRKITENALSGAALPTVEKFYETHGDNMCFATDLTYSQMRETFFKDARSRTSFEEYHMVGRVLHGVLLAVVTNPRANVVDLVRAAFRQIDPTFAFPKDIQEHLRALLPAEANPLYNKEVQS